MTVVFDNLLILMWFGYIKYNLIPLKLSNLPYFINVYLDFLALTIVGYFFILWY